MSNKLRVHSFLSLTYANGPGARCCLWLQGCSLGCLGCFNPETHSFKNDSLYSVGEVFSWIENAEGIEGLTVSGGEPLQQQEQLIELLTIIRSKTDLSVLLFTGFCYEEVEVMPCFTTLQSLVDVLIAGRYVAGSARPSSFTGSANKSLHYFSSRYSATDLAIVPVSEVIISPSGELALTGVDPLKSRSQ